MKKNGTAGTALQESRGGEPHTKFVRLLDFARQSGSKSGRTDGARGALGRRGDEGARKEERTTATLDGGDEGSW